MLESHGLPAWRHWGSLSQPGAPCRAAWAGWDPKMVLGLHLRSESKLGDLSRAIFMKNKVMGNFHPKALWTLRVSSPTSDRGYQRCVRVGNWEVFPWKPAVSLRGGLTPWHRFGALIGAEVVLGVGRHQPNGGLSEQRCPGSMAHSREKPCSALGPPCGQEIPNLGGSRWLQVPPAHPPSHHPLQELLPPLVCSSLPSPLSLLLLSIPRSLSLPFFPLLHPPPDSSVGH